ncbi:MAG: cytochrome c peroxidase [Planctomycetota bacterium]
MSSRPLLFYRVLTLGLVAAVHAQLPMPPVPEPSGNPTTTDKVNLGKALFWDEQMSSTRTMACGTCHAHEFGGADPRAGQAVNPGADGLFGTADDVFGSPGVPLTDAYGYYLPTSEYGLDVQVTGRMAPSVINAAFNQEQFWDGRVGERFNDPVTGFQVLPFDASLEGQAAGPPTSSVEMGHMGRDWNDIAARIAASEPLAMASNIPPALDTWIGDNSYPDLFAIAFGDPAVTPARILMAIAAYERVLVSDQSPYDLGVSNLTPEEQQGWFVFTYPANCTMQCHTQPTFRDGQYHNIGVRPPDEDLGRFNVTGLAADRGRFKTPGMRNLALRKRFMHNGIHTSIDELVEFYDRGGDFADNRSPLIKPLGLSASDKAAVVAFLRNGLLDPRVANNLPPFDRPTLYTETLLAPQTYGQGAAGSGGFEPRLLALEPPLLGNPNFTLALADGLGGSLALLGFDVAQGAGTPVAGVPLNLGATPAMVLAGVGVLAGSQPGDGYWSAPFALPTDPAFVGAPIFAQGFVVDPSTPEGLAATAGTQFALFAPR